MKRASLLLVLLVGCSADDASEPSGPTPLWDTHAVEAVELPASPSVPPELQVPITEGPLAPPPQATSTCRAAAEIPCDGLDQDCDDTDLCDSDGDGELEVHLIGDDLTAARPVTTE